MGELINMAAVTRKKRRYIIYGIIMALLFIWGCFVLAVYPFFNIFNPKQIKTISQISDYSETDYVNLTAETLYYTGFDYVHNNKIKGHYYYSMHDNKCTFFLLNNTDNSESVQKKISELNLTAHIKTDSKLIADLTNSLSKQIGWTSDGLSSLTSPYLICQHQPNIVKNIILFVLLISIILFSLFSSIQYIKKYLRISKKNTKRSN